MALPNSFANESTPNMRELDQNFTALGNIAYVPCAAGGADLITLTPNANTPSINGYTQLQGYSFVAASDNTTAVQIQVLAPSGSPLTLLNCYKMTAGGPAALVAGDIRALCYYVAIYDSALNSGNGGFHIATLSGSSTGVVAPNTVYAGPTSATNTAPVFRRLVGADLPNASLTTLGGVLASQSQVSRFLTAILTSGQPLLAQVFYSDLGGAVTPAALPLPTTTTLGGVLALNSALNQFVVSIASSGQPQTAQVFYSNIGGSVPTTALPLPTLTTLGGVLALNSSPGQIVVAVASSGQHQTTGAFTGLSLTATTLTSTAATGGNLGSFLIDASPLGTATAASANVTSLQAQSLNVTGTGIPVNGVYLPVANTLGFAANGLLAATYGSSQQLVVGGGQTVPTVIASLTPRIQVLGSGGGASISMIRFNSPGGGGATIMLGATRAPFGAGATVALQIADGLGGLTFQGADGTNFVNNSAFFQANVDNTVSTGIVPTRLTAQTLNSAGTGGGVWVLSNEGNMGLGAKGATGAQSFGSGSGVFALAVAASVPTGTPAGAGLIYIAANGNLVFKGLSGTITTLASA